MKSTTRFLRHAFLFSVASAFGCFPASAQDGGAPAAAPAAPAIQLTPVQTPTITNAPAAPAATAAPQQAPAPSRPAETLADNTAERNDFQEFIGQSTGQRLPLYGYNLFQRAPSTFAPIDNIPVTPEYVVGPGDELFIRAWGQIDVDYRATVDRNGMINIPRVGSAGAASALSLIHISEPTRH